MSEYDDILLDVADGVATITINRPEHGNKFTDHTALELADVLRRFRAEPDWRVAVLTGSGEKFFCIGGEHDKPVSRHDYSQVMPIVDVYELIDTVAKPVLAAVNGFAVGGGHVLHVVCDISIASENAVFRQVGPSVGSFDPGYGTWYLEDTIGRKRAKEMWYFNRKYTAAQALEMGLVNEVVPADRLREHVHGLAIELQRRGPGALAALKTAFSARNHGVSGQARLGHDQLLTYYLTTEEHEEMSASFAERRSPNPERFLR
ncbi:enoyl-CoA hydratase-related protein [Actinoallomurus sp. NBC_01490]|uniref:enoyl-CoA hydratase-related protein n=1 Tax=Actinoallomurus sp. NBC_01490 TaxID=2903557 RepID=UPI002E32AC28|nr:enoyl-CoA hydratase-related protein [Actinoallomurus sp. NBC_01490]